MRRVLQLVLTSLTVLGVAGAFIPSALADDETDEVSVRLEAPLDQVDCTAMTVTVLGLSIDIRNAQILSDEENDEESDDSTPIAVGCDALVAGRSVTLKLTNDATPTATEVELGEAGDDDDQEVEIVAPIQGIDPLTSTIQLLGLSIDISDAELEGSEDDSEHDCALPIDVTDLLLGQFVKVELDSNLLPLRASELRILNFANQVQVTVLAPNGQPVAAGDINGIAPDEFRVDIVQKVRVQKQTKNGTRQVVRRLTFRGYGDGAFVLSGLPTGRAKIVVTRKSAPSNRGQAQVEVTANSMQQVNVRLRKN
ncbi:MAG: hypothetical protein U0V87_16830 [Acidobacteriota bacterium]